MPWYSLRVSAAIACAVTVGGCTRANPTFGADTDGTGDASSGDDSNTLGSASMSGGMSASSSNSTTTDSTDSTDSADSADSRGTSETGDPGPVCGDGVKEGEEACDNGEANDPNGLCRPDCTDAMCGDGKEAPNEQCDDGNLIDDDECSNACVSMLCNNGVQDEGEECDPTAPAGGVVCTPSCHANVCHDGYWASNVEACDDDNFANDDDCVDDCIAASCGDGYTWAGMEDCDDDNNANNDFCVGCADASCGDGFWNLAEGGEQCEGGFAIDVNACVEGGHLGGWASCTEGCMISLESCTDCGDGMTDYDQGEECDWETPLGCVGELDWNGDGEVGCDEYCNLVVNNGGCCIPDDAPCQQLNAPNYCCGNSTCSDGGVCAP